MLRVLHNKQIVGTDALNTDIGESWLLSFLIVNVIGLSWQLYTITKIRIFNKNLLNWKKLKIYLCISMALCVLRLHSETAWFIVTRAWLRLFYEFVLVGIVGEHDINLDIRHGTDGFIGYWSSSSRRSLVGSVLAY